MELDVLLPLIIQGVQYLVAVLITFLLWRGVKLLADNQEASRLLSQYSWLVEVASDVVIRVAFHVTEEEQLQYEQEAVFTGRDVRLVIAYRELMALAEERGIEVDLNHLIGIIERAYQELAERELVY